MTLPGRIPAVAALATVLAWGTMAAAVPPRELAERARIAEAHGDPAGAARALEDLLAAGVDSSDVLFDLGTARAEAGRLGEAVWCFEQVARRSPLAFTAQKSLRATRVRLARRDAARTGNAVVETQPPLTVQIGELLPYEVSVPLGVLAEILVIAAWFARRRAKSELRRVAATVVVILAGTVGAFGALVVAARRGSPPAGIVLHDGERLLQGPRVDAIPDTAVREGERVDLLGREGGYVRVRTLAGQTGWLQARDLGPLTE